MWIADAGPLIVLAKAGYLHLLDHGGRQVLVPNRVVKEILKGPVDDPARLAIESGWGTQVPVFYIPVRVRALGILGPGEQHTLALALKYPMSMILLDDDKGRKAANKLGLSVIGTLGLTVLSKRNGMIPLVAPVFRSLISAGLYVDDRVLRALASAVGEDWP
jgi:predicted nucleic acid-binding protein